MIPRQFVLAGLACGLVLCLAVHAWAAAPPHSTPVLTPEQREEIGKLNELLAQQVHTGAFAEATTTAEQILKWHQRMQGASHWETVDARYALERWRRLSNLPVEKRKKIGFALLKLREGDRLGQQRKYGEADRKYREVLDQFSEILGEMHPETALGHQTVAYNLYAQGKYREAEVNFRKAMEMNRQVLGELHPSTAASYNSLAADLHVQGKYSEAETLFRKALEIRCQILTDLHPDIATSCNNLASNLNAQSKYSEAEPFYRQALEIFRQVFGEMHPRAAIGYNNVAYNLHAQGKYSEAEPLSRQALEIFRQAFGEMHANTATSYNNVADNLHAQGKYSEAEPLYRKALEIFSKVLGEMHPRTAISCNNVAFNLNAQGKHNEAEPLFRKVLSIRRKILGDMHPDIAQSYNNLASCLDSQGKHSEADPLSSKALEIYRKVLGEMHPRTAISYNNVALALYDQGKFAEAAKPFRAALHAQESSRLRAGYTGFDRALFRPNSPSSRTGLALCLAHLNQPREAWLHAETALALRLLDDLISEKPQAAGREEIERLKRLEQINRLLLPLLSREKLTVPQERERDRLLTERQRLEAAQGSEAAERSAQRVWPVERIQKQIPDDAAIVLPIDRLGHWVCILRSKGDPVWLALPGSGPSREWTAKDDGLASLTLESLQDSSRDETTRQRLLASLAKQRLAPLEPLLDATKTLPAVSHLLVIPVGDLAAVPVEALTSRYRVSYIPSASVFARLMEQHRPLRADSLLAVGDPVFTAATIRLPDPPESGLLVRIVLPGGATARAGLQPGDVLLRYDETPLKTTADLRISSTPVAVVVWREGKEFKARISGGLLGATLDKRPAAQAVREWRESSQVSRGGTSYAPLPGTRLEVETLKRVVNNTICLTGSAASEQSLRQLASSGKLKTFRLLHLATHGEANAASPDQTCLILAQDNLPARLDGAAAAVLSREKPLDGKLTVGTIRQTWTLDADLVVLSACETGRGKQTGNEGMLGFTQALLAKGARSVVLSRWKVDDSATTLLMLRFYENVLGKRKDLKAPLKRAEALQEAKNWLRTLSRNEAEKLVVRLSGGELRGTVGAALPAAKGKPVGLPSGERPYASAYYWSAFVLLGDPY